MPLTTRSRVIAKVEATLQHNQLLPLRAPLSREVSILDRTFFRYFHALKSPTHGLIVNPLLVLPHRLRLTTPWRTPSRSGSTAQLAPTANRAWFSQSTPHLLRRLAPSKLPLKVTPAAAVETETDMDMATVERPAVPPLVSVPLLVLLPLVFWRVSERFGVYGL